MWIFEVEGFMSNVPMVFVALCVAGCSPEAQQGHGEEPCWTCEASDVPEGLNYESADVEADIVGVWEGSYARDDYGPLAVLVEIASGASASYSVKVPKDDSCVIDAGDFEDCTGVTLPGAATVTVDREEWSDFADAPLPVTRCRSSSRSRHASRLPSWTSWAHRSSALAACRVGAPRTTPPGRVVGRVVRAPRKMKLSAVRIS